MRLLTICKSKIHRATVTACDINYVGSITIDVDLMEAVEMLDGELVHVWNVNNGERFETYALPGERGSGVICINGAAARKCSIGDLVIITAFCLTDEPVERKVVLVDEANRRRMRNLHPDATLISARGGDGLDELRDRLADFFASSLQAVRLLIPYAEAGIIYKLRGAGSDIREQQTDEGILVEARLPQAEAGRYRRYAVNAATDGAAAAPPTPGDENIASTAPEPIDDIADAG